MVKKKRKKKDKAQDMSGWPIPAFLLIGIGIGMFINQVAACTLIGLGVGFLVGYLGRGEK